MISYLENQIHLYQRENLSFEYSFFDDEMKKS